jgi:hypothetical protein
MSLHPRTTFLDLTGYRQGLPGLEGQQNMMSTYFAMRIAWHSQNGFYFGLCQRQVVDFYVFGLIILGDTDFNSDSLSQ